MNVYRDETLDTLKVRRALTLPTVPAGAIQLSSPPGSVVYQPSTSSLFTSNGITWTAVGGGGGGGGTVVIGPGGDYSTLLEALQDGVVSVAVETSFTDASVVDAATMPSNLLIYILPGVVYSYSGTMDISSKRLIITGSGRTSIFRADRATTPYTSNLSSSILCMDCTYSLGTTYNDSVMGQYVTFDTRNTVLESLNPAPTQPMLSALASPAKMTLISTSFIGSSASCRLITAVSGASIVAVNTRFLGTFTSASGAGLACVDTVSDAAIWRSSSVETTAGIVLRVGGRIEQVSGDITVPSRLEIALDGTIVFDCSNFLMSPITASNCSLSLCSLLSNVDIGGNLHSLTDIRVIGTLTLSGNSFTLRGTTTGNGLTISGDDMNIGGVLSFNTITLSGTGALFTSVQSVGDIDIVGNECQLTTSSIFGALTVTGNDATITSCKNQGSAVNVSGQRVKLIGFDIVDTVTFTSTSVGSIVSDSNIDTLQLNAPSSRASNCTLSTLNIDVSTATNVVVTGSTITAVAVSNSGGGVATDPLFVGNRVPDPGATNISPASVGNQN